MSTKLYVPPVRPTLIPRPRLNDRPVPTTTNRLVLVSAPAGYGKTTLISSWLAENKYPVGWLSLDESDNDPVRFLQYLARGTGCGFIGGFAGTFVMDLFLRGGLSVAGLPALTCFSIVGDMVRSFFAILGIEMAGGIPLGVTAHYLIGPVIGAIFGVAVAKVDVLRVETLRKERSARCSVHRDPESADSGDDTDPLEDDRA